MPMGLLGFDGLGHWPKMEGFVVHFIPGPDMDSGKFVLEHKPSGTRITIPESRLMDAQMAAPYNKPGWLIFWGLVLEVLREIQALELSHQLATTMEAQKRLTAGGGQ